MSTIWERCRSKWIECNPATYLNNRYHNDQDNRPSPEKSREDSRYCNLPNLHLHLHKPQYLNKPALR